MLALMTTTGPEGPLVTAALLLVTAALLMLVVVRLAAGFGAANRGAARERHAETHPTA